MKMIIAINNPLIEENVIKKYNTQYEILILKNTKEIIDIVGLKESFLIITRNDLEGTIDFIELVEKIKKINSQNRIILIVKELTDGLKEKLFAKEVFNIIEGKQFLFEELVDNIENPKLVIYKSKKELTNKSRIIFVTGTRCSGKTTFVKCFSERIASNKNRKVLVVDLDFIYPALDTYLNTDKNNSLIDFMKDLMNNTVRKIECYTSSNHKYKNLKYILNNKSIGIPTDEILLNMVNILKQFCDYLIIDTSTLMINKIYSISASINCQVIYLLEESIKSLREYKLDTSYIDKKLLTNTKFILNKSRKNKDIINDISKNIPNKITLIIPKYKLIEVIVKNNLSIINFNKLLKNIGIIKFEKLKLRIVQKILNIEEE